MKRLAALLFGGVLAASCAGPSASPTQPTSAAPRVSSMPGAGASLKLESGDLARCLAGAGSAACVTAGLLPGGAVAGAAAPGAPTSLTATSSGSNLTLTWNAPSTGDPVTSYSIEAGSASGVTNLANLPTGNSATTFSTGGVPNGTYFVRVRASNGTGISPPSNEVVLVFGSNPCTAAPGPPGSLSGTAGAGGTIALSWSAPAGNPTSYVIEAGSVSGLSDLANNDLGSAATSMTRTSIGDGTYFLRMRARNACGVSVPSNEITVAVGRGCSAAPGVPRNLAGTASATGMTLGWTASTGSPTSYVVEAGSASGSSDLLNRDSGGAAATFTATGLVSSAYFVRVRAKNVCGVSAPSNEVILTVGSPFTGSWRGRIFSTSCAGEGAFSNFCRTNPGIADTFVLTLTQNGSSVSGTIDVGGIVGNASGTATNNNLAITGGYEANGVFTNYENWATSLSGSSMIGGFTIRFSLSAGGSIGTVRYPVTLSSVSRGASIQALPSLTRTAGMDSGLAALAERVAAALRSSR